MAMDNELNELLSSTVPNIVNSALARKDRKQELDYAKKHQKEREQIADVRYAEGLKRDDARIALQRENVEANNYRIITDRINKEIDAESGVGEINSAIKFVKDNFTGTSNEFIDADSSILLANLNGKKQIAQKRDEMLGSLKTIMDKSLDSKNGDVRNSFTDISEFKKMMNTVSNNIDFSIANNIKSLNNQAVQLKDAIGKQREVRNFLLKQEYDFFGEEKATLSDGFNIPDAVKAENPELSTVLEHINTLDKAGDYLGAYKNMQYVANNINDGRAAIAKRASEIQDDRNKERLSSIKTFWSNASDFRKDALMTITAGTSPEIVKDVGGQQIYKAAVENYSQNAPKPIKDAIEYVKDNPGDGKASKRLADMLVEFRDNNNEMYKKSFNWDTDFNFKAIGPNWDTKKALSFQSLMDGYAIAKKWNEETGGSNTNWEELAKDNNGKYFWEEGYSSGKNKDDGERKLGDYSPPERVKKKANNGYSSKQLDSLSNAGFDEFEKLTRK